MICDVCGKKNATVHLTEIIDDQMNELHLCEECAHHKSAQMEQQFGLSDLLGGLAEFEKPAAEKEVAALHCPACGLTYADFKKAGRLGCAECYHAFRKYIGPLLKRIHGSGVHVGKLPARAAAPKTPRDADQTVSAPSTPAPANDIQALKERLQKAIENEEFEEAARLRDAIRQRESSSGEAHDH
jgi:protein arginine kinase activator